MDWNLLLETLMCLLTVALKIANGFSIGGLTKVSQDGYPRQWQGINQARDIADSMQEWAALSEGDAAIESRHHPRHQTLSPEPVFTADDAAFLYRALAPLTQRRSNGDTVVHYDDANLVQFPNTMAEDDNGAGGIKYTGRMFSSTVLKNGNFGSSPTSAHNVHDVIGNGRDGDIDVIARLSYPKRPAPVLDNLPLPNERAILPEASKRQQGWFVQYGKRSPATSSQSFANIVDTAGYGVHRVDDNLHDNNNKNNNNNHNSNNDKNDDNSDANRDSIHYSINSKPETSDDVIPRKFPLPATTTTSVDQRIIKSIMRTYKSIGQNLELRKNLEELEKELKANTLAYDIVSGILAGKPWMGQLQPGSSVKRQQGWNTPYGKRNRR